MLVKLLTGASEGRVRCEATLSPTDVGGRGCLSDQAPTNVK